jgi:hypothetical protein
MKFAHLSLLQHREGIYTAKKNTLCANAIRVQVEAYQANTQPKQADLAGLIKRERQSAGRLTSLRLNTLDLSQELFHAPDIRALERVTIQRLH